MKKNIFYWSPCLNAVGTVKSTINSAIALSKYTKDCNVFVINSCGEWNDYRDLFLKNSIGLIDLNFNYFKYLPKTGFIGSRLSYSIIFLFSFFPLLLLLKREKPHSIILHLITSLPLILLFLFDFKSNFILRISGYPKLHKFRKFLWKINAKKLKSVTCPSKELRSQLEEKNIFFSEKLFYLPDAIISMNEFSKIRDKIYTNLDFVSNKKILLAAGRLTKQKNFSYLINEFDNFIKTNKDFVLVILGEGEERKSLLKIIKEKKIEKSVFLLGYKRDIYSIMKRSSAFILSSLWEEMGFVIIEAAMNNLYIISSDCPNGPKEFLNNGINGILFSNNIPNALNESLQKFSKTKSEKIFDDKLQLKKNSKKFTRFRHFLKLINFLE